MGWPSVGKACSGDVASFNRRDEATDKDAQPTSSTTDVQKAKLNVDEAVNQSPVLNNVIIENELDRVMWLREREASMDRMCDKLRAELLQLSIQ